MFRRIIPNSRLPQIRRMPDYEKNLLIPDRSFSKHQLYSPAPHLNAGYLFIGLGVYGLEAIRCLKARIQQAFSGHIPDGFEFLWVGTGGASILPTDEKVQLANIRGQITRKDIFSRFSAYLSENGKVLSDKIERLFQILNKNDFRAEIVIINSLAEYEAALILPISHYLRSVPLLSSRIFRIVSFSSLETPSEKRLSNDGIFLQMKELSRFTSGIQQKIDLGIYGVGSLARRFLIDEVVLSETVNFDLLISSIFAFYSVKKNSSNQHVETSILDITKLDLFTVTSPMIKVRTVLQNKVTEQLIHNTIPVQATEIQEKILKCLHQEEWNHNGVPFGIIADAYQHSLQDFEYDLPPNNIKEGFLWGLLSFLNKEMSVREDFSNRDINWQKSFIKNFIQVLNSAQLVLGGVTKLARGYASVSEIYQAIPELRGVLIHLESELDRWEQGFRNYSTNVTETENNHAMISNSICEIKQADSVYIQNFFEYQPVADFLQRNRWEWGVDRTGKPVLTWKQIPVNESNSMRQVSGVDVSGINEQIEEYNWNASRVINSFLAGVNVYSELVNNRVDFDDLRHRKLISTINTDESETLELSDFVVADAEQLKNLKIIEEGEFDKIFPSSINDQSSIIFGNIQDSFPIENVQSAKYLFRGQTANQTISLFTAEKGAADLEKEMWLDRGEYLGPHFVGLLEDFELFELIMHCFFWGWIKPEHKFDHQEYVLDVNDDLHCVLKNNDVLAYNLRDALYACAVHMPAVCNETNHPFYFANIERTKNTIREQIVEAARNKTLKRQRKQIVRTISNQYAKSNERFYRDLARYLQYKYLND